MSQSLGVCARWGSSGSWRPCSKRVTLPATAIVGLKWAFEAAPVHRTGLAISGFGGGVDAARATHQLARRASGCVVVVEAEVPGPETFDGLGLVRRRLVVKRIWIGFVFALFRKALIALAHLVIRNQCRNVVVFEMLHVGIAVVARVCRDQSVSSAVRST